MPHRRLLLALTLSLTGSPALAIAAAPAQAPATQSGATSTMMWADSFDEYFSGGDTLMMRARRGDPQAQFAVGRNLVRGPRAERNLAKGREWLTMAASQGDVSAQRLLSELWADGFGGPRDLDEARHWAEKAAERGDPWDQGRLGRMLRLGLGGRRDLARARACLAFAAQYGDHQAQFQLGLMEALAEGGPGDRNRAMHWLQRAAMAIPEANVALIEFGRRADLPPGDELMKDLKPRAERGDPEAEYRLAVVLLEGIGVSASETEATAWFERAAKQHHPEAMRHLADRRLDTDPYDPTARALLQQSAQAGDAPAQAAWASRQPFRSAARQEWLERAARQGYGPAQFQLAQTFEIDKDKGQALAWAEAGAKQGYPPCQAMLGRLLLEAPGTAAQRLTALDWLKQAAEAGDAIGMMSLARLYDQGAEGIPPDPQQAFAWSLRLGEAQRGSVRELAQRYAEGRGTPVDRAQALVWYTRALAQNDTGVLDAIWTLLPHVTPAQAVQAHVFETALPWARRGFSRAQTIAGYLLAHGIDATADAKASLFWYERASKQGDADASRELAALADRRQDASAVSALESLRKSAEAGNGAAQYEWALRHRDGRGVPQDQAAFLLWLGRAADRGVPEAQFELGRRQVAGDGVPQDLRVGLDRVGEASKRLPEAKCYLLDWVQTSTPPHMARADKPYDALQSLARSGDRVGQYDLGLRYLETLTDAVDPESAIEWLHRSADQGYAPAQFRLAELLRSGIWTREGGQRPGNPAESARLMALAAAQDYAPALHERALALYYGLGVPRDLIQAIALFKRAAEQGHVPSMARLGQIYAWEKELPFDRDTARHWLVMAADHGEVNGYEPVAMLYDRPRHGERQPEEAFRWYMRAAEKGNDAAMARIGEMYESGDGVGKDLAQAMAWYRRAAGVANVGPAMRLAEIYRSGPLEVRNATEALHWDLLAVDFNTEGGDGTESFGAQLQKAYDTLANARFELARRYEQGEGVPADRDAAFNWYVAAGGFHNKYTEAVARSLFKAAALRAAGAGKGRQLARRVIEPPSPLDLDRRAVDAVVRQAFGRLEFLEDLPAYTGYVVAAEVAHLQALAERGDARSQVDLAWFYANGIGVPRHAAEAKRWLQSAERQGYVPASCYRARLADPDWRPYQDHPPAPSPEATAAYLQARKASLATLAAGHHVDQPFNQGPAPAGYADAHARLARLHPPKVASNGVDFEVFVVIDHGSEEPPASLESLKAEARKAHRPEFWAIATWRAAPFLERARLAKTPTAERQWREKAAEVGHVESMTFLGTTYETGKGATKDLRRAYTWYALAGAAGDAEARNALDRLKRQLSSARLAAAEQEALARWKRIQPK